MKQVFDYYPYSELLLEQGDKNYLIQQLPVAVPGILTFILGVILAGLCLQAFLADRLDNKRTLLGLGAALLGLAFLALLNSLRAIVLDTYLLYVFHYFCYPFIALLSVGLPHLLYYWCNIESRFLLWLSRLSWIPFGLLLYAAFTRNVIQPDWTRFSFGQFPQSTVWLYAFAALSLLGGFALLIYMASRYPKYDHPDKDIMAWGVLLYTLMTAVQAFPDWGIAVLPISVFGFVPMLLMTYTIFRNNKFSLNQLLFERNIFFYTLNLTLIVALCFLPFLISYNLSPEDYPANAKITILIPFISALGLLFLGIFISGTNSRKKLNQYLAFCFYAFGALMVAKTAAAININPLVMHRIEQLAFLLFAFVPTMSIRLIYVLMDKAFPRRLHWFDIASFLFAVLSQTPWFFDGYYVYQYITVSKLGTAYCFFVVFCLFTGGYYIYTWQRYKERMRLVTTRGILLWYFITTITLFGNFLPKIGISSYEYGNLVIIPATVLTFISIKHNRLIRHGYSLLINRRISILIFALIIIFGLTQVVQLRAQFQDQLVFQNLLHISLIHLPVLLIGLLILITLTRPIANRLDQSYSQLSSQNDELELSHHQIRKTNKNIKLLSLIGQEIIQHLTVNDVIKTVYRYANELMRAKVFAVGLYNHKSGLDFYGLKDYDQALILGYDALSETDRLSVWCYLNQREVFINDMEHDYKHYTSKILLPENDEMRQSAIYLPLSLQDRKLGVITVQDYSKNAYSPYHLDILKNIAVYTTIALANAESYREIERQSKLIEEKNAQILEINKELLTQRDELVKTHNNLQLLNEIGQKITSKLSIEQIIKTVYEQVNTLMDAKVFAVGLFNLDKNGLEFYGIRQTKSDVLRGFDALTNKACLSVWCFDNQKAVFINDYLNEYRKYVDAIQLPEPDEVRQSVIYYPLTIKEERLGVITIQAYPKNMYTDYHLDMVKNIAIFTTIALANADSYFQVQEQKQTIEHKNQAITSSMNYARRIQKALLPPGEQLQQALPQHFVLLKPRDIVSGDFYWLRQLKDLTFIVSADCTGHGVPGAFMSMLGFAFLNEIMVHEQQIAANQILNKLRKQVKSTLRQTGKDHESKDGIDMALCIIDHKKRKMQYAGANHPLLLIRDGILLRIHPDRMPIGIFPKEKPFTNHYFDIEDGDTYYLYSDGFVDQFGGERGLKFNKRRFKQLLVDIHQKPMNEQAKHLAQAFNDWKGNNEQVDDVLVIGFRV